MKRIGDDLRVGVSVLETGSPALAISHPIEHPASGLDLVTSRLDRREVEELRDVCEAFLAGEAIR